MRRRDGSIARSPAFLMRDTWAAAFAERARAYWTPERTADLTRGKSLAILPAAAPELLRALGILHRDGTMPPSG